MYYIHHAGRKSPQLTTFPKMAQARTLADARAQGFIRSQAYLHYAKQWRKAGGIDDQHNFSPIPSGGGVDIDADTLRAFDPSASSPIQLGEDEMMDASALVSFQLPPIVEALDENDLAVLRSMSTKVKNPALELFYCGQSDGSISSETDFFDGCTEAQILDDLALIEEGPPWGGAHDTSDDPCCDGTSLIVREGVTPDSSGVQLLQVFGKGEIPSSDTDMELAWDPDELADLGESTGVSMVLKMYGMWKPPGTYAHVSVEEIETMFM